MFPQHHLFLMSLTCRPFLKCRKSPTSRWYRESLSFRKNHPCQKIRWCHEYQNCLSYLMNLTCRGSRQHHLCRTIHLCLSYPQRPLSHSSLMYRQRPTFPKIRRCRWNRLFRMFLTCPSSRCWRFRMYRTYHGNRQLLRSASLQCPPIQRWILRLRWYPQLKQLFHQSPQGQHLSHTSHLRGRQWFPLKK